MTERLIHILPEQVASQIAAGEVVERPASALKELVENSIDAGARSIKVALERGGSRLIAVSDDGGGMGRADAILSLRRHATSKIRAAADLLAIRTLGFRGEALASIASVSRLRLRTRRAAADEAIEIVAEGGEITESAACAIAAGTQIEVRDLFFNTPARLRFLKTQATEQAAAADALQRLALSNFRLAFSLAVEGRVVLDTPRAASALERTRQLFGARLADRMLAFDHTDSGTRAWGLAAASQESFASARLLFIFVNGRVVRDRVLLRAITQAYQTLLPRGRYPAVALFLEIAPEQVDVNVHPMKTEVRFRQSGAIFELVYHALRARLADQVSPMTVGAMTVGIIAAAGATGSSVETRPPADAAAGARQSARIESSESPETLASPAIGLKSASIPPMTEAIAEAAGCGRRAVAPPAIGEHPERILRLVADARPRLPGQAPLGLGFGRAAIGAAPIMSGPIAPRYSELPVIGQLFAGFIALEGERGLILVDQHAAHERVTFEKLRAELRTGEIRVQPALTPAPLELDGARASQVAAAIPELRTLGFDLEPFGASTLLVKGTPAVFGAEGGVKLLVDLIDSMGDHGFDRRGEGAFDGLLKTIACHGSIRAGRILMPAEIRALLAELDRTEYKTNCPHGRPVHIEFRRDAIERMFRR